MARQLKIGEVFPAYSVETVGGTVFRLPDNLAGEYSVILFYRGGW
jgi:alkyl hydroperoxide reductase subunit AhpC